MNQPNDLYIRRIWLTLSAMSWPNKTADRKISSISRLAAVGIVSTKPTAANATPSVPAFGA